MGQKVNPVGFRILNNHQWASVWFDENKFADNLFKDVKIREYIMKNYSDCAISKVIIERTGSRTTVIIKTAKPGILIGKKGADIEKIKAQIKKFGENDVNVKITEVDKPDIDAQVVATSIAKQIENRASYRRVIKKVMQTAMRFGIKGIKIKIGGRLNGAEIARAEMYKEGSIPLHTLKADVDYAIARAYTIYGIVGIKVWVCKK
ncbi:MAG TPA: 30S ribosomal protein S3 [Rickettsiales bacterium]|nr:30S ribosomal protein S3 [Rickettsiales bacterium]